MEKLCRYISRPALCLKRLEVRSDGNIVWSLRKVWRDGTKSFVFTPQEFIAKIAALVPHPREHELTYQGVLAPASPLRDPSGAASSDRQGTEGGRRLGLAGPKRGVLGIKREGAYIHSLGGSSEAGLRGRRLEMPWCFRHRLLQLERSPLVDPALRAI
ncbi:MAG: hypothetical protein ACJAQ3_002266 [Planctomycetota bacterium]|jgi:hypothetical protein